MPRAIPSLLGAMVLLLAGGWGPPLAEPPDAHLADAAQAPPEPEPENPDEADPFAGPPPRDPDDSPFMPAPHNQLGTWSAGRTRPLTRGFDDDHRFMLSVVPTYAAIHVPFIGRGDTPLRGGGVALELDVRVVRWLFVRAFGSHTVHPVFEESAVNSETQEVVLLANGGLVQATNTGASIVYALDIGRFVPRVDVGAGMLFVRSPKAAQAGQWGGQCREGGVCDLGLSCSVDDLCRPSPYPEFHAGIGLDVLLGQHWAVGLAVRYYALLSAISQLPIYLHGSVRLSARF
ncbi:MAG TPA: hypothetical protein VM869_17420 [Enhygromyxa sp.]|nr:hypothetical protein [Enhygromyxa sp.]